MNFCPNCGEKVVGRFCHNCGTDLEKVGSKEVVKSEVAPTLISQPVQTQNVNYYQKPPLSEKVKNVYKLAPSFVGLCFCVLCLLFYLAPIAKLFGESLGNLYNFMEGELVSGTPFTILLIISIVTIVLSLVFLYLLHFKKIYKYIAFDLAIELLLIVHLIFGIVIASVVSDTGVKAGACPVLVIIFSSFAIIGSVAVTILEYIAVKENRTDRGSKIKLSLPTQAPEKPDAVVLPPKKDTDLLNKIKFLHYVGRAFIAIGYAVAICFILRERAWVIRIIEYPDYLYAFNHNGQFLGMPIEKFEDLHSFINLIGMAIGLIIVLVSFFKYLNNYKTITLPQFTKTKKNGKVKKVRSPYIKILILSLIPIFIDLATKGKTVVMYNLIDIHLPSIWMMNLPLNSIYYCIPIFLLAFAFAIFYSITKQAILQRMYSKEGEVTCTIEQLKESAEKEMQVYAPIKKEYDEFKKNLRSYNKQNAYYNFYKKNEYKYKDGECDSPVLLFFAMNKKKIISSLAGVVAVIVAIVLCATLYVDNIFKLSRVEKIELGMSATQVEEILQPQHGKNPNMMVYYTKEYREIFDEIQELSSDLGAVLDGSAQQKIEELNQKLADVKYSMIMVTVLNDKVIDVSYMVDMINSQPKTNVDVERFEIIKTDGKYEDITYYQQNGFNVKVYYSDGSYHMHTLEYSSCEIDGWKDDNGDFYLKSVSWVENYYNVKLTQYIEETL